MIVGVRTSAVGAGGFFVDSRVGIASKADASGARIVDGRPSVGASKFSYSFNQGAASVRGCAGPSGGKPEAVIRGAHLLR